ncbi:MAG: glutathione S-transferase N-terminal domain-containing protein, partial [OCS116 cluster bacterium]|nr:glutathione S-transferase N-terminal domain-containing protein [OCS116 cluster bacterium]
MKLGLSILFDAQPITIYKQEKGEMMELYHNDMSVCSQKVRVTLAEKGLEATKHHLDLGAGDSHTPEYLALNPKGVVPTLIDNDKVIIEST